MKIRGAWTNLFSHCVAIGLAAILENEGKRVKLWWPDQNHIQVETDDGMSDEDMGDSVVSYAQEIAGSDWLRFEDQWGKEEAEDMRKYSPLSPRVLKGGFGENPERYGRLRCEKFDEMSHDNLLAREMFVSIGRPSYWSNRKNWAGNQGDGTSPWIMFSTSQGADYVRKYYRRVCEKIADCTFDERDGAPPLSSDERLRGESASDDFKGEENCDKLYTHGLCESGREIDTLQFWCALHAFACFLTRPVVPGRAGEKSPSNCLGFFKHGRKEYFCLPVFGRPVYFERFKSVLRSADLYRLCARRLGGSNPGESGEGNASDEGKRLGIQCAYVFERLKGSVPNVGVPA